MNLFFQITQNVPDIPLILSTICILHLLYVNVWICLDVSLLCEPCASFLANLCENSNFMCICMYCMTLDLFHIHISYLTNLWIHGMQYIPMYIFSYGGNCINSTRTKCELNGWMKHAFCTTDLNTCVHESKHCVKILYSQSCSCMTVSERYLPGHKSLWG
jgi:hypothetical protein